MIEVKIDKCKIPIIWLDSSVIINMAKWRKGEQIHQIGRDRAAELYQTIYDLVRATKLICPDVYQREEFELGNRLIQECWEVQSELSLGIVTRYRQDVEDQQTQEAMFSYVRGNTDIHLSYKDAFARDPVEEINEKRSKPYYAAVYITPPLWKEQWRSVKANVAGNFERIRQAVRSRGISFEEQLEVEYNAHRQKIGLLVNLYLSKLQGSGGTTPEDEDSLELFGLSEVISRPLIWWNRFGGEPKGFPGLASFYQSDFFTRMPWVEIKCKLYAKMATSDIKVQPGDSMDINQLSVVIPYFDLVITDRKMKDRITQLALDQQFRTKVFSMRDFPDIIAYLDDLDEL